MPVTPLARPQAVTTVDPPHSLGPVAPPSVPSLGHDQIQRSAQNTDSSVAHKHGFGIGLVGAASAEAGVGGGLGATASAGAGVFFDGARGVHPGAYAGGGAFAGGGDHAGKTPQTPDSVNVAGGFAGAGVGVFVTNAASAAQLGGTAQTYSCNVGFGPLKFSVQLAGVDGTYLGSVSIGPGIGLDVSRYPTQSAATR